MKIEVITVNGNIIVVISGTKNKFNTILNKFSSWKLYNDIGILTKKEMIDTFNKTIIYFPVKNLDKYINTNDIEKEYWKPRSYINIGFIKSVIDKTKIKIFVIFILK